MLPDKDFKRLFENNLLIKNNKSFWEPPFFKKAAFFRSFCKKLHQKRPLILKRHHDLTFQTVSNRKLLMIWEDFKENRFKQILDMSVPTTSMACVRNTISPNRWIWRTMLLQIYIARIAIIPSPPGMTISRKKERGLHKR
ncbi:hypothetical protein [Komagataeibacter swingsii]|uniref:Uncharacterized protein n=1 Tax=Komagataeibacter swingsii TaxID=215220 RepID=A0A850NTZ4_9PROT|nr:hypothetical protein [Komagataeibacter swingsii]NVN35737.1 hypothetical protein [Komagataeibacter swingsii]